MGAVNAWIKCLDGDSSRWSRFTSALQKRKVGLEAPVGAAGLPGLVLLPVVDDDVVNDLASLTRECTGPVLTVALRRSDLAPGGSWRLLQAGAADVLVCEECNDRLRH